MSKINERVLIISGFNLTRRPEVEQLAEIARKKFGLGCLLTRNALSAQDRSLTDWSLEVGDEPISYVRSVKSYLSENRLTAVGIIPFSDDSTEAAAAFARANNLPCFSEAAGRLAFSKAQYRTEENRLSSLPPSCFSPKSVSISSLEDVEGLFTHHQAWVIKPTSEGNNRGVVKAFSIDGVKNHWPWIKSNGSRGLMAEQLIPFEDEFSIDGIGENWFITHKITSEGEFPTECGQAMIPVDPKLRTLLGQAFQHLNAVLGKNPLAFHHEIKVSADFSQFSVVEPNLRPAGMGIWELARLSYGIDLYEHLVEAAVQGSVPTPHFDLKRSSFTMLISSPVQGVFKGIKSNQEVHQVLIEKVTHELGSDKEHVVDVSDWAAVDSFVENQVKDNSNYVIKITASTSATLSNLKELYGKIENATKEEIKKLVATDL